AKLLLCTTKHFYRQHCWAGAKIINLRHFPSPLSDLLFMNRLSVLSLPFAGCKHLSESTPIFQGIAATAYVVKVNQCDIL
ncbi:MAG: hypothetical protein ABN478_15475, partial [Mixta sp.]